MYGGGAYAGEGKRYSAGGGGGGGGGGGLFLACEDLGRIFDHSFPACAFFVLFCFFEVEISSRTLIPHSVCQNQITVAQRAETTVAACSLHSVA